MANGRRASRKERAAAELDARPQAAALAAETEADMRSDLFFSRAIIHSLREGIIVIDRDLIIREFNPAAERLTGQRASDRIGQKARQLSRDESPIFEVLRTGRAFYNVESTLQDGRVWNCNFVPLRVGGRIVAAIQTFTDVTEQKKMEQQLKAARDELDEAFALTLPNTKVEFKLKNTPEFRDVYDPETGTIRITEVIPDGGYRHVINALKVLADLHRSGGMSLIGIDKDDLVRAVIFHDLGKSQPKLAPGDVVDPKAAFEPSKLHAERSAAIARDFYNENPAVVALVRYHHHDDSELPPDFPISHMPMLRLLKLVDGLSAALTRRGSTVSIATEGVNVIWHETSPHPRYHGAWSLNLFTGERVFLGHDVPDQLQEGRRIGGL
ncbi:MAG: PAS domain-containing protein [Clostridia bacterium]|nr:PAS domain-containing protein [Clostridia bacterium]